MRLLGEYLTARDFWLFLQRFSTLLKFSEMDVDLYAFFGISEGSSAGDIKKAYKDKARQLHPDKNKDNPRASMHF